MWFENKVTSNKEAFLQKVRLICAKLGIEPDWLMFVMNSESGLNPAAYNPNGGASGLIQFMPDTAKGLGTTTEALRKLLRFQFLKDTVQGDRKSTRLNSSH